jgi:peptidoglycan/xylan/chitin deacetylase (PgdA/CDA1 family)
VTHVLCYHAVSERWPAALSVTPSALEAQLAALSRRGPGVTFAQAASGSGAFAMTFDDAYRSVIDLAFPRMAALGVAGTVFVPTAWTGGEDPMVWPGVDHWAQGEHRDELLPMTWEQLAELADAGWEIGSHTRSHPRLTTIDDARLAAELRDSRTEIEDRLGRPCRTIAYPYGDVDARVADAAREAGYTAGCSLPRAWAGRNADPLLVPRIGVYNEDGRLRFAIKRALDGARLKSP